MPQDLSAVAWPIRTDRLTIRPCLPEDCDAMFAYRTLPEVADYLPSRPTDPAAFAERFRQLDFQSVTLMMQVDGVVVGDLFLMLKDGWAQAEVADRAQDCEAEIGWAVSPSYAGRGLATEAARELLRICFEDLGVRRVVAVCFADNRGSRRIMDKLGMRLERQARAEALHRTGEWRDGVGYALLADEWREITRRR